METLSLYQLRIQSGISLLYNPFVLTLAIKSIALNTEQCGTASDLFHLLEHPKVTNKVTRISRVY